MNLEASALETLEKCLNVLPQFDYYIEEPKKKQYSSVAIHKLLSYRILILGKKY